MATYFVEVYIYIVSNVFQQSSNSEKSTILFKRVLFCLLSLQHDFFRVMFPFKVIFGPLKHFLKVRSMSWLNVEKVYNDQKQEISINVYLKPHSFPNADQRAFVA